MLRRIYRRLTSNSSLPRTSIVCLMFHRIAEVKEEEIGSYPKNSISPSTFEAIIAFFSERFHALSLPDLVAHLADGESLPPNTFAVTFDDGFLDTWSVAKPILESYEVPATVYVTTGYVGGEVSPYEFELANVIASRNGVHFHWEGCEYHWDFKNKQDRERCFVEIKRMGKPYPYTLRRALMTKVFGEGKPPNFPEPLYMNWPQVVDLSQSPLFTIGAHTHRHVLLPSQTSEEVFNEIDSSKKILESKLGFPIQHFAYPYGSSSPTIRSVVQCCKFASAVGTKPEGINPETVDCFAIPRIELKNPIAPNLQTIQEVIHACGYL
jgi:peptidoglycan/xylan/chitin deacetylase (PgdA/CDA1 family)